MNLVGWRAVLFDAFDRGLGGDETALNGIARQLAEEDEAKQLLRNAGFGSTGKSLLLTVQEVLAWVTGAYNPADGADGT